MHTSPSIVVDAPDEVDWAELPARCVLQLHWAPERTLVKQLRRHRFQLVTLSRHPFDVLLSILHFATVWQKTASWFGGRSGDESAIVGATPSSSEFLQYATGPRARALLSISPEWSRIEGCTVVSYERLVADPLRELTRAQGLVEGVTEPEIRESIRLNSIEALRSLVENQHYWRGRPGHWKRLIPGTIAEPIFADLRESFTTFGYGCDPDETLTRARADANWFSLELATLRQELCEARRQLRKSQGDLELATKTMDQTQAKVELLTRLGPNTLGTALALRRVADRLPRASGLLGKLFRTLGQLRARP
jgi:hypothetical protein